MSHRVYSVYWTSWAFFCRYCDEPVGPIRPFKAGPARRSPKLFIAHLKERHPKNLSSNPDGWPYQVQSDFFPRGLNEQEDLAYRQPKPQPAPETKAKAEGTLAGEPAGVHIAYKNRKAEVKE